MKGLMASVWAELLKIRKSKLVWLSIGFSAFIALVMAFLMFVVKNPESARKYGLLAAKASIAGEADWPSFFTMLALGVGGPGLIGFGFLASWVFGREYSDRTFKDLLALPISRSSIVASKFVALAVWCVVISAELLALGLLAGTAVGLEGWSLSVFQDGVAAFSATCVLTILLVPPVALFAGFGRGYLPPLGFVILTLLLANVVSMLGYGTYFPWAIPMLVSGYVEDAVVGPPGFIVLFLTCGAGLAGTFAWWRFADQA